MKHLLLTKLLKKYNSRLVVVFGAHGRGEARKAIETVLSQHVPVFSSPAGNFFKGLAKETGGFFGILRLLIFRGAFPHVCIVDASSPSNVPYQYIKSIIGLDVVVAMPLGDIPSFSEVFAGPERGAKTIMREASIANKAIIVMDDETLRDHAKKAKTDVVFVGFDEHADIKIEARKDLIRIKDGASGGTHFKVEYDGSLIPFTTANAYGKRQAYATLSALGVAIHYDINLISAAQDMQNYNPPAGSLNLRKGIKNTVILEHHLEVTPFSAREALEIAGGMHTSGMVRRVVLVMGDILPGKEEEAEGLHRTLGEFAAHSVHKMFLVGERVLFTDEEAQKHGMLKSNIHRYDLTEELIKNIQGHIKQRDLILVIGSREMKMEKVVEELEEV